MLGSTVGVGKPGIRPLRSVSDRTSPVAASRPYRWPPLLTSHAVSPARIGAPVRPPLACHTAESVPSPVTCTPAGPPLHPTTMTDPFVALPPKAPPLHTVVLSIS